MAINRVANFKESNEIIDILSNRFYKQIASSIKSTVYSAAENYKINGSYPNSIISKHSDEIELILRKLITRSIVVSSKRQYRLLQQLISKPKKSDELYDLFDIPQVNDELNEDQKYWMLLFLRKNLDYIPYTTRKEIDAKIKSLQKDTELSSDDIADNLKSDLGDKQSLTRASIIAGFVAHTAVSWASLNTAKTVNRRIQNELKKEWISMRDSKVRDDHAAADGQIVGLNDFFLVGSEKLEFPGDPNGSIENTINCRCIIGYIND